MIGSENAAIGLNAPTSNDGDFNTAVGFDALASNTTGPSNTATGNVALYSNQTGKNNTATGDSALYFNQTGNRNVATGLDALDNNISGGHNVGVGNSTLDGSTTGEYNTALGYSAGWNLTTGDNNIIINNVGVATESNTIRIGSQVAGVAADGSMQAAHTATYIAGITRTSISRGATVFVDSNGRLGLRSSSERFKDEVKPMDKASEAILSLKPVTFRY